ncbi:hypothetical protein H311_05185, partial [Anncaliia algerae PRA109]
KYIENFFLICVKLKLESLIVQRILLIQKYSLVIISIYIIFLYIILVIFAFKCNISFEKKNIIFVAFRV